MRWFEMPVAVVLACLAMLPRLTAEESLLEATRVSVGSGVLKTAEARGVVRQWQRTASSGRLAAPPRVARGTLAAMGIGYVVVPPRPAGGA